MASVTAVRVVHPPSLYTMPELYAIDEDPDSGDQVGNGDILPPRPTTAPSPFPTYPMYSGLHGPSRLQDKSSDSFHAALKRPRKLSSGSTYSTTPFISEAQRARSSSWGTVDNLERKGRRPRSYLHQRPMLQPIIYKAEIMPNELFDSLPGEVLGLVLQWLKKLHLDKGSGSCATCWMRDLCNISLSSRKWYKYARVSLYEDIQLVGPDSAMHKKKFKQAQGSRMVLLRRTLRASPDVAGIVRTLKVPRPETPVNWSASKGLAWLEQYEDRVATLVMACPNLERLSGPTSTYDHSFKKIFHALSTRTALKEMIWILDPAIPTTQQRPGSSSKHMIGLKAPELLSPSQEDTFLDYHRNWPGLRDLSVHCQPGATLAPHTLLSRALTCLPSLRHLHLCNLPSSAFNDDNLLSLPPIQSLVLSHITGITSGGLSAFATRPNSSSLRRLDLRHTPLTSLPALARIFSNLPNLTTFSLVQTFQPVMPETDSFTLWMMPYLASSSIVKLHWDITNHVGPYSADDILARSIAAGGFPSLTTLRAPNDAEGRFQALCRPVDQIAQPGDRFGGSGIVSSQSFSVPASPISPITPVSPIYPLHKSSTIMSLPSYSSHHLPSLVTDLQTARLAAQSRLEAAQDINPRIKVNVTSDDGRLAQSYGMASYLGTLGSKIKYHLHPDEGATDEHGGLLDVSDLVGDGGETLSVNQEGCTGRWNYREGEMADKREKEKWWHTERGRWRKVELK
ncbi:hypothetical protein PT974_09064 [Cladobotryum mycophilum]|uniref:F-box domain-containing protein n=1 Tax=Cladobotryum mycophilum TaxID=491253 RepID=A0ABR0SF99_9HYPO